ncbi:CGNR zinc finger domain-containing protein [Microbacterium sp. 4R-513]|uniref:CGNR zinc finger domain-containing protein n=1 Tax=Microbacterium sp. 4R-513 TaxID=2567934 RepID=UPI0013E1F7B8|nr:CGNR zinc finger domain-containing protein [Microbacterium sp. 4R-513]QIG40786.1 CGNR zinc finger domain-containing protein [Microbacterium sp. 4R-513]
MVFTNDTRLSLAAVVNLVNTLPGHDDPDRLETLADFDDFLAANPFTGRIDRTRATVDELRAARGRLRRLWDVDRVGAVPIVNEMLRDSGALPQLVIHDSYDWHIHATSDDAPLSTRILAEAAMAFVDVIRSDEYDRIRVCSADDCESVYVDYSRNGSKRYCDTGNCGNRMNVIAYRARKARETA